MANTIYALLVGINDYPAPVNPLQGCVNDIESVNTFLLERIGKERFKPLVLTNEKATREAVIAGFREHLGRANAKEKEKDADADVALFYYSGHGSQEPAPAEFWAIEPDRQNETLVCYDSRTATGWDLADKELAQLIAEVAANHPHLLIILDCCHSGSGTRAPQATPGIRLTPADTRQRRPEDYILTAEQLAALKNLSAADTGDKTGWTLPRGRHILFAACADDEEAKEQWFESGQHGAFTNYLLDALQQTGTGMNYRDLHKRINARVRNAVAKQSPQLEATEPGDLNQPFLGGAVSAHEPYFTLTYDKKQRGWFLDGGAIHGIPPVKEHEPTMLALFAQDATISTLQDLTAAVGEATVTQVSPSASRVTLTLLDGQTEDQDAIYKAVVTAWPLPPMAISLEGEDAAVQLVRDALNKGVNGQPSLFVREVSNEQATLRVVAEKAQSNQKDRYRIVRKSDIYPLAVDVEGHTVAGARQVVQRLEHIERWQKIANLTNQPLTIAPDAIKLELFSVRPDDTLAPIEDLTNIRLEYEYRNEQWQSARFKLKLTNTTNQKLYCALLDLTETYAVWPGLIAGTGNCVELDPQKEPVWAFDGQPIPAWIPNELWAGGVIELKERVKVIISNTPFDASLLEQDELEVGVMRGGAAKGVKTSSTLDRLMSRVQQRGLGPEPGKNTQLSDWTTNELVLTIVRPQETAPIRKDVATALGGGVRVKPHPSLQAQARLTSVSEGGRNVGNLALPPLLRNNPDVTPFEFSATRNGEPGLSVLELVGARNPESVTREQPLELETRPLGENEYVIAVAYEERNGQLDLYVPLGIASQKDKGVVKLERLPNPSSAGSKDPIGTIKIFFQKVVGQPLGLKYHYPLLRAAEIAEDGKLTYSTDGDLAVVRAKVANAQRVLLYVHGITGDTRSLAASARPGWLALKTTPPGLIDRYDLILAFDYESVNTKIQDNARKLKERLAAVGLGPNHGKTLHIVAHSMGGLVSRWFIEQEQGGAEKMVQHLVMVGTPNAGSPWPTVQDWVTTTVGIALNGLSTVALPVKALGSLLSAVETIDVALDQMQPGNDFLAQLAASPDPGVPYTIIAGHTALIAAALTPEAGQTKSRFERLWDKIKPKQWFYQTLDLAFFNQPNDIAVSVDSIQSVPVNRTPAPKLLKPVACDHTSYFTTDVGLEELATAFD